MVSSHFAVSSDSSSAALKVVLPKGVKVLARPDSFLASSGKVRSIAGPRDSPFPLQQFWADSGDDNVLWLAPPFTCSILLIERSASDLPLYIRTGHILALQESIVLPKRTCCSGVPDIIEVTGSGMVAIVAVGKLTQLTSQLEFGQVASSKIVGCMGVPTARDAMKNRIGISKFPGPGRVYVSSLSCVTPKKAMSSGISLAAWYSISSQLFFFFLFIVILGIFGDSLADWFGIDGISEKFQAWTSQFM